MIIERVSQFFQVYKQKVKHMLYDHQNDISALKLQVKTASTEATQECKTQQEALQEDKAILKQQLRQQVPKPSSCHQFTPYCLLLLACDGLQVPIFIRLGRDVQL